MDQEKRQLKLRVGRKIGGGWNENWEGVGVKIGGWITHHLWGMTARESILQFSKHLIILGSV